MRSPLRKELFACFQRKLLERFAQFALFEKGRGTWTWRWTIAPHLTFFLFLQAYDDKDQFTVEVAWSDDGEFPFGAIGRTKIDEPQGRQRLGKLWDKGPEIPVWDVDPEHSARVREYLKSLSSDQVLEYPPDLPIEKALPRVAPLVDDALDKFEQFGMPLFRQVAEVRGIHFPGR
jgi:hypothetical protein